VPGITVIPVGAVPDGIPETVARFLEAATSLPTTVDPDPIDPAFAYDRTRGQMDCRKLLPALQERATARGTYVLGLADVDLFSAIFTFVFGEAHLGGTAGLFSIHRLRPELYGLPLDPELLIARARREALHETGHLLGLVHCRTPECAMQFSGSAEEVDLKNDRLCTECRVRVESRLGASDSGLREEPRGEIPPGNPSGS
jgi:archaemetzincin